MRTNDNSFLNEPLTKEEAASFGLGLLNSEFAWENLNQSLERDREEQKRRAEQPTRHPLNREQAVDFLKLARFRVLRLQVDGEVMLGIRAKDFDTNMTEKLFQAGIAFEPRKYTHYQMAGRNDLVEGIGWAWVVVNPPKGQHVDFYA